MVIVAPIINFFIALLVLVIEGIVAILPNTPFEFTALNWGEFGQAVGAFIPLSSMFTHFALILVAIGTYYIVRLVLRWIKMIR